MFTILESKTSYTKVYKYFFLFMGADEKEAFFENSGKKRIDESSINQFSVAVY